ncbi:hypothetical protein FXW78_36335 [Rhodococcus opacus]|nr:hypothetical protein [Rhodococcus opacus]
MVHTVCAETGVPSAASAAAISPTDRSRARRARTRSRIRSALRGPFGPGRDERNSSVLPMRSSCAIWCTVAAEYPKSCATCAALAESTKYARSAS